ncbi:MAG: hemerythrin domain-containing protein [Gammaproteobacteria bacterium]
MLDLRWHEFYSLDVDFLDEEHQRLLAIMRQIKKAIEANDMEIASQELSFLLESAEAHFKSEEKFLEELNYPGLEEHKKYHQELINQGKYMKDICEGIVEDQDVALCFKGMSRFIIDDIFKGDIKFKSFIDDVRETGR